MTASARFAVAARIALAVLGGYVLAALATTVLALGLPLDRADAVTLATTLSFAIYAGAALWVFGARALGVATLGILLPALVLSGLVLVLHGRGG